MADALGKMGPAAVAAVPGLVRRLEDRDDGVRWAAADALGRIGSVAVAAVPQLVGRLTDHDKGVQTAAAKSLANIADDFSDQNVPDAVLRRHLEGSLKNLDKLGNFPSEEKNAPAYVLGGPSITSKLSNVCPASTTYQAGAGRCLSKTGGLMR